MPYFFIKKTQGNLCQIGGDSLSLSFLLRLALHGDKHSLILRLLQGVLSLYRIQGLLAELLLSTHRGFASSVDLGVASVRLQNMGFYIVVQLNLENVDGLFLQLSSSTGNTISTLRSKFLGIQSALPMYTSGASSFSK